MYRILQICALITLSHTISAADLILPQQPQQPGTAAGRAAIKHIYGNVHLNEDYFNTANMNDTATARQLLADKKIYPQEKTRTEDGAHLETYGRTLNTPDYSVILAAGYSPGRLYGMISYCELLDAINNNSNMWLFHARDRGNSTSRSPFDYYDIWHYGQDHWKDIQAMIEQAYNKAPEKPIYLVTVCSGAFHTLHALYKMGRDTCKQYNIQGVIADSTMTSPHEMARTAIPTELTKGLQKQGKTWTASLYAAALHLIRYTIYLPFTQGIEKNIRLNKNIMNNINVPIGFVHGTCDAYSDINTIKGLRNIDKDRLWQVKSEPGKSVHAVIQMKRKYEYLQFLRHYIPAPQ